MMLLINEKYPARYLQVTGVDRLFIAPEMISKKEISPLNDVWSIGVILYLLITGGGSNDTNAELKFTFEEEKWNIVSDSLMDFVIGCCQPDSKKRMSIMMLQEHSFLQD